MNPDDLWIGDNVILLKSGRRGVYEGVGKKNKAKVVIGDKVILSSYSNLKVLNEKAPKPRLSADQLKVELKSTRSFLREIDLHIDQLDPTLKNAIPQLILNKQVEACKSFIRMAIQGGLSQVTIIHGKGTGQLRSEVHHILQGVPEVMKYEVLNEAGATLVTLKYSL